MRKLCCSSDSHILKSNNNEELTENTAKQRRIDVILLYYITSHKLSRLIERCLTKEHLLICKGIVMICSFT